jgi:hypothetical protein
MGLSPLNQNFTYFVLSNRLLLGNYYSVSLNEISDYTIIYKSLILDLHKARVRS